MRAAINTGSIVTLQHLMKIFGAFNCAHQLVTALILLATLGTLTNAQNGFFDGLFLDHEVDFGQMRGFALLATPTESSVTVTVPSAPTSFDAAICSAYPEICVNAGLLPVPTQV